MMRILKWLSIVTFLVICGYIVIQRQIKSEVVEFLVQKVPDHIDFSYANLEINLLKGYLGFEKIEVLSLGRQTSSCEIVINADQLIIVGFSYWKLFFKNEIYLKKLTLSKPNLHFKSCPEESENNASSAQPIHLLKPIFIEELVFESGVVEIRMPDEDTELLSIKSIDLHVKQVSTDPNRIKDYIPFEFSEYEISLQQLSAPLGKFEMVQMESMLLNNSFIEIKDISLMTFLSKSALSKKLSVERDHYQLTLPDVLVQDHTYSRKDDTLHIFYKKVSMNAPELQLYRDKSLPDNTQRQPLFSERLRGLPFKISIDSLVLENATLLYEENLPNDAIAGVLTFENLEASLKNISNQSSNKENLKINLNADLMGAGAFNLDWEFNVQDSHEAFIIAGGLSNLNTARLNDFLVPNLRTKAEGTIDQLYFTISGDAHGATGDLKMRYTDFKFQVLNKERNQVKKVLSFIGNLFVNDGSRADENGFRYGNIATERDQNKSFFNFLWINLEDGLIDVLTGTGKKD